MDKFIYNAFQNLPNIEMPTSLHTSIMRATIFRRAFRYVSILTFIIGLAFALSLWHLHTSISETEAFVTLKAVVSTLDFSLDSIIDSAKTLLEFLPVEAIILSLINFIALIFMVLVLRSFMRLESKFTIQA